MLGRVRRQSMSSLEELEMEERYSYSSKLIKHDSLSIYEATLMKLKEGSKRDLNQLEEDPTVAGISSDSAEQQSQTITTDSNCSSVDASINSKDDEKKKNFSVFYMFSRYKNSQQVLNSPDSETMVIDNESCFDSNSPSSE